MNEIYFVEAFEYGWKVLSFGPVASMEEAHRLLDVIKGMLDKEGATPYDVEVIEITKQVVHQTAEEVMSSIGGYLIGGDVGDWRKNI